MGSNVIAQHRKHGRAKIKKSVSVVLSLRSNEMAKYRCLLGINVYAKRDHALIELLWSQEDYVWVKTQGQEAQ